MIQNFLHSNLSTSILAPTTAVLAILCIVGYYNLVFVTRPLASPRQPEPLATQLGTTVSTVPGFSGKAVILAECEVRFSHQ